MNRLKLSNTQKLLSWAAFLASQVNPDNREIIALARAAHVAGLSSELERWLRELDAPKLVRMSKRGLNMATDLKLSINEIHRKGDSVIRDDVLMGKIQTLYKPVLPVEWQVRLAYETFFDRFFAFLAKERKVMILDEDELRVDLFIPKNSKFNLERDWEDFIQITFSQGELTKTFVLGVNSLELGESFHDLPVPIISLDQAQLIAAFFYAFERRIRSFKDPSKHQSALDAFNSLPLSLNQRDKLNRLSRLFGLKALQKLAPRPDSERVRFQRIPKLLKMKTQDCVQIPSLLSDKEVPLQSCHPGDFAKDVCYACRRPLPSKGMEGKDWFKATKFVLASPSQTLQSQTHQNQPKICSICAALSIVSPIKLSEANLVVALKQEKRDRYLLEHHLRMLTLGELNIAAGRYVLIPCVEKVGKDLMIKLLGGREYALYKVSSLFPSDVFLTYEVEVLVNGAKLVLPSRHFWILSFVVGLFDAHDLRPEKMVKDKKGLSVIGEVIRHIEKDQLIHALYRLAQTFKAGYDYSAAEDQRMEDLCHGFVNLLQEGGITNMDKAQRLKDVAGLTGMLYAFADNTRRKLREKEKAEGINREIAKLIEKVDEPNQFCYGAAQNAGSTNAILFRGTNTHFIYEEVKRLLEAIDVIPAEREEEARKRLGDSERDNPALLITFDDIAKVFCYLFETRYKTEKDQREFTYELKLSLYARFPEAIPGKTQ